MAGTITISTLKNDTGVLATQNGMTGIAKAWVNFAGVGSASIRDSFNVSSVTYNGSGDYTVNFTTAMPNANYAPVGIAQRDSANICVVSIYGSSTYNMLTTTTARFFTKDNGNSTVAAIAVGLAFFSS